MSVYMKERVCHDGADGPWPLAVTTAWPWSRCQRRQKQQRHTADILSSLAPQNSLTTEPLTSGHASLELSLKWRRDALQHHSMWCIGQE